MSRTTIPSRTWTYQPGDGGFRLDLSYDPDAGTARWAEVYGATTDDEGTFEWALVLHEDQMCTTDEGHLHGMHREFVDYHPDLIPLLDKVLENLHDYDRDVVPDVLPF